MSTLESPTRRAPAMPPDERRAAIVSATLPLLATHGETVTSRQIAEAAGVAEGTIFGVFADKDELMIAALDAALDQAVSEEAYAAIDPDLSMEAAFVAVVEILRQRIVDVWAVVSNLGPKLREQASRPIIDSEVLVEVFERYRPNLRSEPRRAARMLKALTLSLTHPMLFDDDLAAEEIVEQFLRGAEVRS